MLRLGLTLFLYILVFSNIQCTRILAMFPTPSISHQVTFRPLCHELAKRGHEVIVITPDPAFPKNDTPPNLREIDVHDISYSIWKKHWTSKIDVGKTDYLYDQIEQALKVLSIIFQRQIEVEEVQKLIQDKNKFDLILLEGVVTPTIGLSHVFKAPVIFMYSYGVEQHSNYITGSPAHPLVFFDMLVTKQTNLSNWDKIREVYNYWQFSKLYQARNIEDDEMLRKLFDPKIPPLSELYNNIDLYFFNIHPIWDTNRPTPPNVIHLGGIHQNEKKELPKDLEAYLNSSQHGVIYFSFGTNTIPSKLQSTTIQTFIKVFSKLPYDVLWKWDADELPGRTENIRIFKWLPQSDLLRHPKVKLFITQGGLQSTDEAIVAGVPLIGIPMLGDQWFNVEKYVQHKIGVRLDFDKITEDLLKNAIETVIGDKSFRNNIIKLRSIMNDQPQTPLERAVWWTEYLLRHGGTKHLRSPSANMPWRQYYEIDLIMIIVASLIISISAIAVILLFIFKLVSKLFVKPAKSKKL